MGDCFLSTLNESCVDERESNKGPLSHMDLEGSFNWKNFLENVIFIKKGMGPTRTLILSIMKKKKPQNSAITKNPYRLIRKKLRTATNLRHSSGR
ncbi:hypothetical protein J6590_053959 [Homalodisca vitripennis]|nr:hypothetical protein J6590_053959 [Homalodisca vitripennis]